MTSFYVCTVHTSSWVPNQLGQIEGVSLTNHTPSLHLIYRSYASVDVCTQGLLARAQEDEPDLIPLGCSGVNFPQVASNCGTRACTDEFDRLTLWRASWVIIYGLTCYEVHMCRVCVVCVRTCASICACVGMCAHACLHIFCATEPSTICRSRVRGRFQSPVSIRTTSA